MSTAEERLWNRLWNELDALNRKVDSKIDYRTFNQAKEDLEETIEEVKKEFNEKYEKLDDELTDLTRAAVSPDQVTTMIGQKLQESEARGITQRERLVRYGIALITAASFALLLYDRFG